MIIKSFIVSTAVVVIFFVAGGNATTKEECGIREIISKEAKRSTLWAEMINKPDLYEKLEGAQSQKERKRLLDLARVDGDFSKILETAVQKCTAKEGF